MEKSKCKYFSTIEKEEAWLNKMMVNGWSLIEAPGFGQYRFIENDNDNLVVRIDVREFKEYTERNAYIQFISDSGWEYIKSREKSYKLYFLGQLDESDELFSDDPSKYERELRSKKKIDTTNSLIMLFYVILFFNEKDKAVLFDLKKAFLTPGIWEKTGEAFRKAFLFELPFALVRILLAFGPFILLAYLIYQSYLVRKSINRYKQRT